MEISGIEVTGLNNNEVDTSRKIHGANKLEEKKSYWLITLMLGLVKEPMILLLLIASLIYFITGETGDAVFLCVAIVLVGGISVFQDRRSSKALQQLKKFTQPVCKLVRNNQLISLPGEEIVVGDTVIAEEGSLVVADGKIIHAIDFAVDESVLTGESLPVYKSTGNKPEESLVFSGTTVISGMAIIEITAVGVNAKIGKIGSSIDNIQEVKTPLEIQIANFVKKMVLIGLGFFLVVWAINFYNTASVTDSLLKALTLAMSILPEEIPVAFASFMAIGSWRLMQKGIIVRENQTVEVLGSATVICADKTGTITENKMKVEAVYLPGKGIINAKDFDNPDVRKLIFYAMAASEQLPYDPMEIAIHQSCKENNPELSSYKILHQYSLSGKPPMMTNIIEMDGNIFVASKGAPEAILRTGFIESSDLKEEAEEALFKLAEKGYRVLGVAGNEKAPSVFPPVQTDLNPGFIGLIALADPPKENIPEVLEDFYRAGVKMKILTGDNSITTLAIADKIGFKNQGLYIEGKDLENKNEEEFKEIVKTRAIFTRLFPEAKLKIIEALKSNGEIVAMTGDGINDGPALKAAHIGVAMGKNGTEVAKQAASLVISDDDLSKMVDAIALGRKIYTNLKKAIQYIISIHIPIILIVFIPLALGWIYPNIFTPVHVIFLELIMGPTCSIVYEQEPMEPGTMNKPPKPFTTTFFNFNELSVSIIQGLVIAAGTLLAYNYAVSNGYSEDLTRTMSFITLIIANIFLTLVNRSFYYSLWVTLRYKNYLIYIIIGLTILLNVFILTIEPLTAFFKFESLNIQQIGICLVLGLISVGWFEVYKYFKRRRNSNAIG